MNRNKRKSVHHSGRNAKRPGFLFVGAVAAMLLSTAHPGVAIAQNQVQAANRNGSRFEITALIELLDAWGSCVLDSPCPSDLDGDGLVGASDLLDLLTATPASDGIPEGCMIIEGDIIVPEDFYEQVAAGTYVTNLWPGGIVPYEFDVNVNQANRAKMLVAMADWESVANVDFRPRNGEFTFVHIQNGAGNSSRVGMGFGQQFITIYNWGFEFIMVHELGHALGFWHEQSRADRDNFVQINYANICQDCCHGGPCDHNFDIRPDLGSGEYGPYDFDSVMHYGQCAFSVCYYCTAGCRTIRVLPPYDNQWQDAIGQRDHLSHFDALTMSFLYSEPDWRFVDLSYTGIQSGTFLQPFTQFIVGAALTPPNGTLWVQPGSYFGVGVYDTPMTIQAPLGGVSLGIP